MAKQADQEQGGGGGGPPTFETFAGVNTSTTRPGVPDQQAYWLDGFFPIAPRNLRTLYGIGSALYTASGKTIVCFYFYNIGATPYGIVFLSDGSAVQVNTATGATTTVLAASTIQTPSITNIGVSQWGQQYLLIVANQANGYWVWDGSTLYTSGTLSPVVTLTNVGSGYKTPPLITATGGHGSGATFTSSINSAGNVSSVTVTNAGSGYLSTDSPTLVFTGGNVAGSGAVITATMSHIAGGSGASVTATFHQVSGATYQLSSLTINSSGSGYSGLTSIAFTASPGSSFWGQALTPPAGPPTLTPTISNGQIVGVSVTPNPSNPGNYYVDQNGFPTIAVSDPGYFTVSNTTISNGGSNYGPNCSITASGGNPYFQATFTPILTSGVITAVTITGGGAYSTSTPPTLTITDSASNATATISLMPFGVQGNCIETYQGHVWVFNGPNFNFSAPGSVSNFATSAGGGSQQSSDSFLKVGYVQAVSTNGFLFVIGDTSMSYISGVTTTTPSGGSPTTTYTYNNCDPEQGSPYPAAVNTLGQDILVANSTGIFISSGGAFVKQSEAMDGVYNTVAGFGGGQLSSAKATIFAKRVWMVLVPIIDPITNIQVNKLLMWNGRYWWASAQDVPLTFIQGQEINSVYTAWGTDGTHIYPLFSQPSAAFVKTAQSRLWDAPGYEENKAMNRFWSLWQCFNTSSTGITVEIDAVGIDGSGNQFTNSQTLSITGPTQTGFFVTPPEAPAQQGVLMGMTISTSAADMALISAKIDNEVTGYRG